MGPILSTTYTAALPMNVQVFDFQTRLEKNMLTELLSCKRVLFILFLTRKPRPKEPFMIQLENLFYGLVYSALNLNHTRVRRLANRVPRALKISHYF